ncbi:MAG: TolC family protein [Elusimicrobiales bacterium]
MKALILLLGFAPAAFAGGPIVAGSTVTLEQCVGIALGNDPDMQSLSYTEQAQRDVYAQTKSGYLPYLSAEAGFASNKSSQLNEADRYTTIGDYDSKSAALSLKQLVFDFGKTPAAMRAASSGAESARQDIETQAIAVANQVKKSYYAVLFSVRGLALSDEILEQYRKNLSYANAHYEAKIKPRYDVTKAEADLSGQMLNNIQVRNNVLLAQAYLKNAMNLVDAPDFSISDNMDFVKYPVNLAEMLAKAYAQRPDLRSLEYQAKAAEQSLKSAAMDRLPALNGSAGYGFAGTQSPISRGWNAGLSLSADLFTGLRKSARVAELENRLAALRSRMDSLKLSMDLDVKTQYLALTRLEQAIATAKEQVRAATENLDIANVRYQTGLSAPVEISDATVTYNNAKMNLLQSLYDYKTAQADMERATGSR